MKQQKNYQECCHDEFDKTDVHENEIYDLYEKDRRPPPPLDNKMFSVLDSILKHTLAIRTEQFLE